MAKRLGRAFDNIPTAMSRAQAGGQHLLKNAGDCNESLAREVSSLKSYAHGVKGNRKSPFLPITDKLHSNPPNPRNETEVILDC